MDKEQLNRGKTLENQIERAKRYLEKINELLNEIKSNDKTEAKDRVRKIDLQFYSNNSFFQIGLNTEFSYDLDKEIQNNTKVFLILQKESIEKELSKLTEEFKQL